jgi:MFS family permease
LQPTFPSRIANELRDYWVSIKSFQHNARMYLLASMLMAVGMAIQQVLYNLYLVELGFTEDFIGQVAAAVALGVAMGGIPSGLLYDRLSGRFTFPVATLGIVMSMVMRSLIVQPEWLIFGAVMNGVTNSIYFVSIFPFITGHSSTRERAHLYGANIAVWTGFMMLGSFLAGFLPGAWSNILSGPDVIQQHRMSLLTAAVVGALATFPFLRIRPLDMPPTTRRRKILPSSESKGSILRGAIALFLVGMVIGLTTPFYNVYFKRIFAAQDTIIGTLFSLSQIMGLLSAFFLPYIVRRWGLVLGPSLVLMVNAPFIFAVGLPLPFTLISFLFLFSAGMERLGEAPLMNLVMEAVPPNDRGAMSGIRLISSYGAQALAGALGGWLIIRIGYSGLFTTAAGIQTLAAGAIWYFFRSRRQNLETSRAVSTTQEIR